MPAYQIDILAELPHPLGRHVNHDPANYGYRALVVPPPRAVKPYRCWPSVTVFDQGQTSRCTVEAAVGLLRTNPYARSFDKRLSYDAAFERQALYLEAQTVDPWPGEDYDGTSTDAPFKVLRNLDIISSWRWLFGETELREWVTWYGPAVVGTEWYMNMFYPDLAGNITVAGAVAGGHAYRVVQYHPRRDAYRIVNSWGRGWGQSGRAWIKAADMAMLLERGGEAVTVA